MAPSSALLEADWLAVCRAMVEGLRVVLEDHPTTRERAVEAGRGEGGDLALVIDRAAERVVFSQLDRLHGEGHRFTAVSEERGLVDYGGRGPRVVIDPIDGSLNAKRGLSHHAISIAVADGETMADVVFGYVYDFGPGEEWSAWRGQGVYRNGSRLAWPVPERRADDRRLELVGMESADPRWVADSVGRLDEVAHRLRAIGSVAISLCQVAGARMDGMLTLWKSRAVDAAAGQLIVRESGGEVAFTGFADPLAAPLDLEPRSPLVAARTKRGLAELARVTRG